MDHLLIDTELVNQVLKDFLIQEVQKANFKKVVLGLSGGVDSSVVTYLCTHAFPLNDITVLILPFRTSDPENIKHAETVAKTLKINYEP